MSPASRGKFNETPDTTVWTGLTVVSGEKVESNETLIVVSGEKGNQEM
ncbi:MAG TPA: hypothetical protein P5257_11565 [Bacteroidales bacterium]|nr:hypothetical protein [Bacteroidales bacterium]